VGHVAGGVPRAARVRRRRRGLPESQLGHAHPTLCQNDAVIEVKLHYPPSLFVGFRACGSRGTSFESPTVQTRGKQVIIMEIAGVMVIVVLPVVAAALLLWGT
jgi:hypothetical protein